MARLLFIGTLLLLLCATGVAVGQRAEIEALHVQLVTEAATLRQEIQDVTGRLAEADSKLVEARITEKQHEAALLQGSEERKHLQSALLKSEAASVPLRSEVVKLTMRLRGALEENDGLNGRILKYEEAQAALAEARGRAEEAARRMIAQGEEMRVAAERALVEASFEAVQRIAAEKMVEKYRLLYGTLDGHGVTLDIEAAVLLKARDRFSELGEPGRLDAMARLGDLLVLQAGSPGVRHRQVVALLQNLPLESEVSFTTKTEGATVKYRPEFSSSEDTVPGRTNDARKRMTIGYYYVWTERGGVARSPKDRLYAIIEKKTRIDLDEEQ